MQGGHPGQVHVRVNQCSVHPHVHSLPGRVRRGDRVPLREKMNGHRSAIKNGEDTPVANHFKEEHSARVSVLTSTPEEVVQRRLMERAWIRRLSGEGSPWTLINRDAGIDVEPLD